MRDELLLKARLLVDGVRISDSAYEGVGKQFKEQVHHLFEYDFDLHQERSCPAEMRLPSGTVVGSSENFVAGCWIDVVL